MKGSFAEEPAHQVLFKKALPTILDGSLDTAGH